ncbi:transcription factor TFIIB [Histomonas meleagridis]|uniref:transcription factor TFIIB n=1 Tax=Histomonas meleagridis TaxID=135588 RepID=UPI0035594CC9|nr:transcription factor TFIIB [Histomonas meleagridis]KAH0801233.1 transcription factor TFIIB [Histomonas meleagridis]
MSLTVQQIRRVQNEGMCPYCKSKSMRESPNSGEYYCAKCGYISPHAYIDQTSEYRQFAIEHGVKDRSRSSYANDEAGEDLFTSVYYDGTDKSRKMAQLAMQNYRNSDPQKMTLKKHVRNIRLICESLNLEKSIKESASKTIKQALEKEIAKKKKIEAMDAAAVFLSCEASGNAKSMVDILQATNNVTKRDLDKAIHQLRELYQIDANGPGWETEVKKYIPTLHLSKDVENACIEFGQYIRENGILEGKKRATLIAAIIACVTQNSPNPADKRDLTEISTIVGPKPETINSTAQEISVYSTAMMEKPNYSALMNKKV